MAPAANTTSSAGDLTWPASEEVSHLSQLSKVLLFAPTGALVVVMLSSAYQDFSVGPGPLGTNWVFGLIGTWLGPRGF